MVERVLHLPIIESGTNHDRAFINKRGLTDALRRRLGDDNVRQMDYLAIPRERLHDEVVKAIYDFEPTMMLTQLHAADCLTPADLHAIRSIYPEVRIVNWSGDSHLHGLTAPSVLDMCHHFDMQLVASPDVLPIYKGHGIPSAFWQIAYESPVVQVPSYQLPLYDVVFLGNVISDKRRSLLEFLRTLEGISVGIYGDWDKSDGECTYDFGMGEALYKNAKIAIADLAYKDSTNYVSNRPIQVLMAGGALLLHEHVDQMETLLGIHENRHYLAWDNLDQLETLIRYTLPRVEETDCLSIVQTGKLFAQAHHTYDHRVKQLFEDILHL